MATLADIGHGASFAFGDGASPEVFTAFAEVTSITPPSDNIDVIDATHMASPGNTREFIQGLNDPGEASFEINWTRTNNTQIQALRNGGTSNFRITFPGSPAVTWTFAGFLIGYEPSIPVDDKMTATVTFKVTSSYTQA